MDADATLKKVLVTGAAGLLGSAVVEQFAGHAEVHAPDRARLDITDVAAVARVVRSLRPDAIINCAAYNDVDGAEQDARTALAVNAVGVRALTDAARAVGAVFVHYSTDFVFDGETSRPYVEEDRPNPRSVYACSKLLGEWLAADAPRFYVLRVESLFGGPGVRTGARRGSLGSIVDRIRARETVPVFIDRTVSPSFTPDVARATRALLSDGAPSGLYHCVNEGAATWREVAERAAALLGLPISIRELTLATVPLKAARPRYCALSPARLRGVGVTMPTWQDAMARYLAC
jgi:dTDP-4-dehydrorhamnose reductase